MWNRSKLILLAALLILVFAQSAYAILAQRGPINPNSGFPLWYKDTNGVVLDLPTPPVGDGVNAPTMIYDPVVPTNPFSVKIGFGTEAFYFLAVADPPTQLGNGKARVTLGLEAAFSVGPAIPGDQIVFARIRIRAPVQTAGTYKLYHPWGVDTIDVTAADVAGGEVFYTRDVGVATGNFNKVLSGPIGPFLRATAVAPGVDPARWVGDGVTSSTVTGSPLPPSDPGFNKVRFEGPPGSNVDGLGNNFIQTNQFVVSGHIPFSVAPFLQITRATLSSFGLDHFQDIFATSDPTASLVVTGANFLPPGVTVPMPTNGAGNFFAHIPSTASVGFPVKVTATAPGGAQTIATRKEVDFVNITVAKYSVGTQTLTIRAISSIWPDPALVLTAASWGTLKISPVTGVGFLVLTGVTIPPPSVTVTSFFGGSDTTPVTLVP